VTAPALVVGSTATPFGAIGRVARLVHVERLSGLVDPERDLVGVFDISTPLAGEFDVTWPISGDWSLSRTRGGSWVLSKSLEGALDSKEE
jgi:hypothetical protein